jgi:signal transduction histidine kinase
MADQRLFKDLAPQVASAVHSLRLSTELERSRLEAVTTREEARRRLGGDLHDGIVQRMTGLLRKIEVMENHLDRDTVEIHTEAAKIIGDAHAI